MPHIMIIHPEGNISNNPNLTGIVEILCDEGYKVDIYSPRLGHIAQVAPCAGAKLVLANMGAAPLSNAIAVLPIEMFQNGETLSNYIANNIPHYDLIIGVDRGIIEASIIAKHQRVSYGLISYEILFSEETGKDYLKLDIDASRDAAFAVCQDRVRSNHLSRENGIPLERITDIPVAGRSAKQGERTFVLHEKLGLQPQTKIALYIGGVTYKWAGIDELITGADQWPDDWAIVLHQRYSLYPKEFISSIDSKKKKNVYISPFPALPFSQLHQLIHSADIGLSFYIPQFQSNDISACNNLKYVGLSSGKTSTYLQHGLPILINEVGEMADYTRNENLGRVVGDIRDIPSVLSTLSREELTQCRENSISLFKKLFDLDLRIKPLLSTIHRLVKDTQFDRSSTLNTPKVESTKSPWIVCSRNLQAQEMAENKFKELQSSSAGCNGQQLISKYNTFIIKFPLFALAHNDLGVLYTQSGDDEKALQHYEAAVRNQPDNATFAKNLADFYLVKLGRLQDAIQIYRGVLDSNNDDLETLFTLGNISIEHDQPESAKHFYKRVLEIEPKNNDAVKILDILNRPNPVERPEQADATTIGMVNPVAGYLVSAIVSTYNSERFIRGCIEDLEAQTIADRLEIVIVDSCSPQNERAIVEELQKKYSNIKYIRTETRETVYAAWNRGIKAASGKYITNANADDRHRRDAFEIMVNELEKKPDIALVYADVIMTEKENETFDRHTPCGNFKWLDWDRSALLNQGCFMGPQPMWRRSVHEEYGYFDEAMVTSGDYEFWLRISQTNNFCHIKTPLGLYLKSPESIEHRNREKQRKENNKILSFYRDAAKKGCVVKSNAVKEAPSLIHPEFIKVLTSIIILTQNRMDLTKKCVKSIRKHTPEPHEIIFVDNGSTDGTVKWLQGQAKENKNYRLIENKENVGLAKGRNQGINLSQGEFILLTDNDVLVSEGWLDGMLECLNRAPAAGIVGPMTNNIRDLQQVMDESYRSVDYLDKYAAKFKEQYRHRQIPYRNIAGFCMLFKRTLAENIGLLDERFGADQFEDEDFCLRASLEDYRNYIAGDVFVHHHGGKGSPDDRKILEEKWVLSITSPEGKKLAVLKSTELADELYQKGKVDQAAEALINCIKLTPEAKEIFYELARIFIEAKKFSEALEVVESMPESARDELKGLECAGYTKEGLGLDDEAAGYADRMLTPTITPTPSLPREGGGRIEGTSVGKYPPALNLCGVLAYKKGEKEAAADHFKKAIDADPGYGEAYTNLGVLNWSMDKKEEALAYLRKGFVLSPTVPDTSSLYYSVVSSLGAYPDAEADFREACRLYPNHKSLAFLLIDILIQQEKFEPALIKIEDSLVLFGIDGGILNAALAVREKTGPLQIAPPHSGKKSASKKSTLSLCMIVKNEEKSLVKCLKSVRDVVDEMIVVDTGSTDKTIDIARVFGAQVFDFPWTGDFSAARNHSLAQATGDWVLILDADEIISARDLDELKALIRKSSSSPAAYSIFTRNYTRNVSVIGWTPNSGQCPEEAGAGWATSAKVRLFTRRKDVFFSNPVHEMLEDSLKKAKIPFPPCKIVVHHYGKLDMELDSQKNEDYYLLGKMKYESDPTNVKYINELAKQAQALDKYEEAVELWQQLISLLKADPESPNYKEIASVSYGEPVSEIYIQLASAYMLLDLYEEALAPARKAIETRIKIKEYVHIYAHCEIIVGSLNKAFSALEELLETTPDYLPALFEMAVIFCLEGKTEKAQELFQLLLQKGVQMTPLLNITAKQLHANGKRDEALIILNTTIENKINDQETTSLYDALHHSRSGA